MNFIKVIDLVFKNIHTIIMLLGITCIVVAIGYLTNIYYGLLAIGIAFIIIAIMLERR